MKAILIHIAFVLLADFCLGATSSGERVKRPSDIYLIIYITRSGHTGHVGFAIDNYRITVRDTLLGGNAVTVFDTVKTRTVTYFDLWGPPEIDLADHDRNLAARYFTLPRSSAERPVSINYFLTRGLPHAYDYPCDALLRIRTTPLVDARLREIAEGVQRERNYFNSRAYNCTDYVLLCLNRLLNREIEAREFIPFQWSSTPNRFYKAITESIEVDIIKEPGDEVNNSFFRERILKSEKSNQSINYEKDQ